MKLIILTQREKLYEDEVKEVSLPGRDGELSVWDFHQPFLYRLGKGNIRFGLTSKGIAGGSKSRIPIKDGIAKMLSNTLTVLAEV
ncbi:MAG: hypothetical protein ISS45_03985 [Candidatus Omnitrophica bacterium]|nr:hypothetical protein [Candidatus Omnitrophota bacterium]